VICQTIVLDSYSIEFGVVEGGAGDMEDLKRPE
jgi:hypothetical protein